MRLGDRSLATDRAKEVVEAAVDEVGVRERGSECLQNRPELA